MQEVKAARAMSLGAFPWMVDLYIKLKEDDGEQAAAAAAAKTADARSMLVDQVRAAAADIAGKTDLFARPLTSLDKARPCGFDLQALCRASRTATRSSTAAPDGHSHRRKRSRRSLGWCWRPLGSTLTVSRITGAARSTTRFSAGAHDKSLIEFESGQVQFAQAQPPVAGRGL